MKIARIFMWAGALVPALLIGLIWGVEGIPLWVGLLFTLASAGLLVRVDCRLLDREEEIEIALVCLLDSRRRLIADVERLARELNVKRSGLAGVEVPDSLPEDL